MENIPKKHRAAFEFRHKSWYDDDVQSILESNDKALVLHDHADAPTPYDLITTNFSYIRFHGPDGRYSTKYTPEQLKEWLEKIKGLVADRVYCYFNNDNSGFAIENAKQLREFLILDA